MDKDTNSFARTRFPEVIQKSSSVSIYIEPHYTRDHYVYIPFSTIALGICGKLLAKLTLFHLLNSAFKLIGAGLVYLATGYQGYYSKLVYRQTSAVTLQMVPVKDPVAHLK